jgi:hypothetical protein
MAAVVGGYINAVAEGGGVEMKAKDIRCRNCKRNAFEIQGYLHRINVGVLPGVYECRPYCNTNLTQEEALVAAIEGESMDAFVAMPDD